MGVSYILGYLGRVLYMELGAYIGARVFMKATIYHESWLEHECLQIARRCLHLHILKSSART